MHVEPPTLLLCSYCFSYRSTLMALNSTWRETDVASSWTVLFCQSSCGLVHVHYKHTQWTLLDHFKLHYSQHSITAARPCTTLQHPWLSVHLYGLYTVYAVTLKQSLLLPLVWTLSRKCPSQKYSFFFTLLCLSSLERRWEEDRTKRNRRLFYALSKEKHAICLNLSASSSAHILI